MSVQITEGKGLVLEVQVSGKLTHDDYLQFVPELERLIKERGRIRILLDMTDFHGWEAQALWDDIKFDVNHLGDIERLAMIGDKTWEKWMAAFCRPFTRAKIRYFDATQSQEARAWLEQDRDTE